MYCICSHKSMSIVGTLCNHLLISICIVTCLSIVMCCSSVSQDQRELLTKKPEFQETMALWKAFPQQNKATNSSSKEVALAEYIQASSCKSLLNSHETAQEVSEPALTAKRQDFSSFGSRVHLDTGVAVYKVPLQGWEGIS